MFKIKKGLDIPISGKPSNELTDKPTSNNVGVIASDYVGMKPTMLVKVGDQVSLGQKLYRRQKILVFLLLLLLQVLLKILIEERSVLLFQWKLKRIH